MPHPQYVYHAVVLRVVDADTVELSIDVGFGIWKREITRLARINAAELNTAEGKAAKAYLTELIQGKAVVAQTYKSGTDKYGRYLADLYLGDGCVNDLLVEAGHAGAYHGRLVPRLVMTPATGAVPNPWPRTTEER
jgi:micrococcal nuclease